MHDLRPDATNSRWSVVFKTQQRVWIFEASMTIQSGMKLSLDRWQIDCFFSMLHHKRVELSLFNVKDNRLNNDEVFLVGMGANVSWEGKAVR